MNTVQHSTGSRGEGRLFAVAFFIALLALIVLYFPALSPTIHGDDFGHISKASRLDPRGTFDFWELDKDDVRGSWQLYSRVDMAFPGGTQKLRVYWRPWQNALNIADTLVWGKQYAGWKFTNFLLAALGAAFIALAARRLGAGGVLAVAAGVVWAMHPSRELSIVWLSARGDGGSSAMLAASMYFVIRGVQDHKKWHAMALLLYAVALGFKEAAIPFALVVWAFAAIDHGGDLNQRLKQGLRTASPYIALMLAYALFRFGTPTGAHVANYDGANTNLLISLNPFVVFFNLTQYLLNATVQFPIADPLKLLHLPIWQQYAFSVMIITAVLMLAAALLVRRSHWFLFGLAGYYIMLLPVIGVDPRTYFQTIPLIFLCTGAAPGLQRIWTNMRSVGIKRLMLFCGVLWAFGFVAMGIFWIQKGSIVPRLQESSVQLFYQQHPDLGDDDRVYFINFWESMDITTAFILPYLPNRPRFYQLTYNPSPVPARVIEQSMGMIPSPMNSLPKPTIGITKTDDHSIDISINQGHFMDVNAIRMWLPEKLYEPIWDTYNGEGFYVEIVKRDATGFPDKLRFHFTAPLCDPHAHFFLADGILFQPLNFCTTATP